jgi:hypothetical protein
MHDMKLKIEAKIMADGLDPVAVKGKIGLRAGKLLAFINQNTPDDPQSIAKLKVAAKEVLDLNL